MSLGTMVDQNSDAIAGLLGMKRKELRRILMDNAKRAPREERQDVLQSLTVKLLETRPNNGNSAYAICQNWIKNYWKARAYRQHYSLDQSHETIDGSEHDPRTLEEMLVGETGWERRIESKLDTQKLYGNLPGCIKLIVNRRLIGKALTGSERVALHRYLSKRPTLIIAGIE